MSVALTGGCLVVACWGAWRWTESLVLRWLCRAAASNAASHLVWLSFRVLWVQALDSSWCFPLYCAGKLIKASFFFFYGWGRYCRGSGGSAASSQLTHAPSLRRGRRDSHSAAVLTRQSGCLSAFHIKVTWKKHTFLFFFLERKKFFPRNFAKPKARRC